MSKQITLREYVDYGIKSLLERKAYFTNIMVSTTNPLEKLSCKDKIEEIDVCINYFNNKEIEE